MTTSYTGSTFIEECKFCNANYKYEEDVDSLLKFKCTRCDENKRASNTKMHQSRTCHITIENDNLVISLENDSLVECDQIIKKSVKNPKDKSSYHNSCICKDGAPVVMKTDSRENPIVSYECLDLEVSKKITKDSTLSYTTTILHQYNSYIYYNFFNCPPYKRNQYGLTNFCLCQKDHIFLNGRCKICSDEPGFDKEIYFPCKKCSPDKILSSDGMTCTMFSTIENSKKLDIEISNNEHLKLSLNTSLNKTSAKRQFSSYITLILIVQISFNAINITIVFYCVHRMKERRQKQKSNDYVSFNDVKDQLYNLDMAQYYYQSDEIKNSFKFKDCTKSA
ncbi:MAG: hypothetical protein MHPSP_003228 [Paramarteilia canceri]